MDVIANNISNVNTVGFKSSRVTFNEVFAQTLSGAAGPNEALRRGGTNPMQIGLGANVASIDMLMTTGAAQRTDNPFDVMIQGEGFFVVSSGDTTYYTRAGAFRVDEIGNLTMPNGLIVNGYDITPDPNDDNKFNVDISQIKPIQISGEKQFSPAAATSTIEYTGNMNALEDGVGGIVNSIGFFDSEGNKYTVDMRYTFNPATKDWTVEISNYMYPNGDRKQGIIVDDTAFAGTGGADGEIRLVTKESIQEDYDPEDPTTWPAQTWTALPGTIKFKQNGRIDDTLGAGYITGFQVYVEDGTAISAGSQNPPGGPGGGANKLSPEVNFYYPVVVTLDQLTQFNIPTDMLAQARNGHKAGNLIGLSVGTDGIVTGRYDNGQTKQLAQIVLAQFDNPAGLERNGNNLFSITNNSGAARIGTPAAGGSSLLGGVLEMANVDLAGEFTEMITTQRGFQANSRTITTSDEMLQELVNLKR
jgi:flagellar hook protein FlgE